MGKAKVKNFDCGGEIDHGEDAMGEARWVGGDV